jgi:Na+/H+-translocating membrane pyrophosphatase
MGMWVAIRANIRTASAATRSMNDALQTALRSPYVVQEAVVLLKQPFPVYQYGELQTRELDVAVQPHTFLGKMQGVSAALSQSANGAVVPVGIAPALLLAGI